MTLHPRTVDRSAPRRLALVRFVVGVLASVVLSAGVMTLTLAALPTAFPGWSVTAVSSGSMEPALHVGDAVAVAEWPSDRPMLDAPSVILVDRGDTIPVLHRVVEHDGVTYHTKGDANFEADTDRVRPEQVIGVGRLAVRGGGWLSLWVGERNIGALVLFALSAAALLWLARFGWLDKYDPWLKQPANGEGTGDEEGTDSGNTDDPDASDDTDGPDRSDDSHGGAAAGCSVPNSTRAASHRARRGRRTKGVPVRLATTSPFATGAAMSRSTTWSRWCRRIAPVVALLAVAATGVTASSSAFTGTTLRSGTLTAATVAPPTKLSMVCSSRPTVVDSVAVSPTGPAGVIPATVLPGDILIMSRWGPWSSTDAPGAPTGWSPLHYARAPGHFHGTYTKTVVTGDVGRPIPRLAGFGDLVTVVRGGSIRSHTVSSSAWVVSSLTSYQQKADAANGLLLTVWTANRGNTKFSVPRGMTRVRASTYPNPGLAMAADTAPLGTSYVNHTSALTDATSDAPVQAALTSISLAINSSGSTNATLSWTPSTSAKVTGYRVFRDATLVATVDANTTSWSTTRPPSSTGTTFEVQTVTSGWTSSKPRLTVRASSC